MIKEIALEEIENHITSMQFAFSNNSFAIRVR